MTENLCLSIFVGETLKETPRVVIIESDDDRVHNVHSEVVSEPEECTPVFIGPTREGVVACADDERRRIELDPGRANELLDLRPSLLDVHSGHSLALDDAKGRAR